MSFKSSSKTFKNSSLKNSSVFSLTSLLNLSCLVFDLSIHGSFSSYPNTRQSKIKSISSENLSMSPKHFESDVPPLKVKYSFHLFSLNR